MPRLGLVSITVRRSEPVKFPESQGAKLSNEELAAKKQELEALATKARAMPVFQAAGIAKKAAVLSAEILGELTERELKRYEQ